MPTAAKLEKQASSNQAESSDNNNANTPIRQALVIIEHKIRNLEKRKTKLESYRAIQLSGKELSTDQKAAVAKYDEVAQSLEFARELCKQMVQLATTSEKDQKKQARREMMLRTQAETAKIREVLTIQNILTELNNPIVREDFMNGSNEAIKLEESDVHILEKFYMDIQVSRQSTPEDVPFHVSAQKAAEYLSLTIDGRPKQYGETTYDNVRRILQSIQECGYLDKAGKIEIVEEIKDDNEEEESDQKQDEEIVQMDVNIVSNPESVAETCSDEIVNRQQILTQTIGQQNIDVPKFSTEAPSAAAVPAPAFPQQPQPPQPTMVNAQIPTPAHIQRTVIQAAIPTVAQPQVAQVTTVAVASTPGNPLHAPHYPTTVRAVEQAYFKQQQQQQQQYIQQMRPLAEVIEFGSAHFYFLQESELDSPDMVPSGFTPEVPNNTSGAPLPPQSPNSAANLSSQSVIQQIPLPQPGMQQNVQQQPANAPIPTQTFTNQSFPPIVPPPAIFPQPVQNPDIPNSQPQIPVFQAPPIPIAPMVAQPVVVSQAGITLSNIENKSPQVITLTNQPVTNSIITGPSGASVPLPGFPNAKFVASAAPMGIHQVTNQLPVQDKFEQIQNPTQNINEKLLAKKIVDEVKERAINSNDKSNDWDGNEAGKKSLTNVAQIEEESNQWSNEVANSTKNEWNNNYDNQNDSNTWNSNQNDNYSGRNNRNTFGGTNRTSGNRGLRGNGGGGGGGGPPSNGYRGRANNSYQQQQNGGRNSGMYFRNNNENNGYYQNQNGGGYNGGGGGGGGGNKQDNPNNYGGNSNNTYRSRGGPMPPSNRQQNNNGGNRIGAPNSGSGGPPPPRNNSNSNRPNVGMSNPNNRPGRNNSANTGTYGSSRPPNNVRQQQQDVNA